MADVVKTLTDDSFAGEIAGADKPYIVDFWAPWCGPCRMAGPILEDLAGEYDGKVMVGKLNVDENPGTAGQFGVMSIPTIILFRDGEPARKIVGVHSKAELVKEFGLG